MSQHTPDAWIERNEDDPRDPYYRGGGDGDDEIFDVECSICGERCNSEESPFDICPNCWDKNPFALRDEFPLAIGFPSNGKLSSGDVLAATDSLSRGEPKNKARAFSPAQALQQQSTQEINGIVGVLNYFNRRFGINE